MSEELKPCPFCQDGGKLFINGGVGCRWVECSSCGCDGPARETEAEAIEAWNTRAERTCHKELMTTEDYAGTEVYCFECSECGEFLSYPDCYGLYDGPNYCPNCGAKVVERGHE